jgi:hypothetical protein
MATESEQMLLVVFTRRVEAIELGGTHVRVVGDLLYEMRCMELRVKEADLKTAYNALYKRVRVHWHSHTEVHDGWCDKCKEIIRCAYCGAQTQQFRYYIGEDGICHECHDEHHGPDSPGNAVPRRITCACSEVVEVWTGHRDNCYQCTR